MDLFFEFTFFWMVIIFFYFAVLNGRCVVCVGWSVLEMDEWNIERCEVGVELECGIGG